ncbi:MAG: metallophosphoesterase, partial [Polyangiaceae bacterium]|nr:metallophosphoesterase [Polyangiaceae bacterium]
RDADARLAEELIATVARERPAAVVVSGDLVDESPHEHQCRAAGRFLAHLRRGLARAGFDVPIYFVLGNHDTKHFGNNWFVARVALLLVAGFSLTLGLALDAGVPAQIVRWTVVGYLLLCCLLDLLLMVIERWSDGPVGAIGGLIEDAASAAARAAGESAKAETGTSLEPTGTPGPSASVKVELFGFDSSARSSLFGFATGRVGRRSLGGRTRKQDDGAACRIAVVHHHPLPVLHDGSEPDAVMMLENAGTFLRACFRHGVKVVLHGHKHVPDVKQLVGADGSGVPIVVAGAGTIFADDSGANRAFGILRWQGGVPRYEPVRLDGAHAPHPLPGEGGREDALRLAASAGDAPAGGAKI